MENKKDLWSAFAPWFLTSACTVMLGVIGWFLVDNINWFKQCALDPAIDDIDSGEYRTYAFHMHLSMIKRSVGLFSGFAVMFLGFGVAFFTLKDSTSLETQGGGLTAKIVTASPGLVALIVGATIIISVINSKDSFDLYSSSTPTETEVDLSDFPKD